MISEQTDSSQVDPREVRSGESPVESVCPFWVKACLRLAPPTGRTGKPITSIGEAIDAAGWFAADRMPVHGKRRLISTRDDLAGLLGKSRGDKVGWITDYFERIQFLTVQRDHGRDPASGQMRGHVWVVHMQPPLNYVGPRDAHELAEELRRDGRARSLDELFLEPQVTPTTPRGVVDFDATTPRGENHYLPGGKPQVTPTTPREVVDFDATTPRGENRRSRPLPPGRDSLKEREASLPEGKRSEASASLKRDAAPRGGAGGDALERQVRDMARLAPWSAKAHVIRDVELDRLVPVIVEAMRQHDMTLEQAQQHLDQAVARLTGKSPGKRVDYVVGAFTTHLAAAAPDEQRCLPLSRTPDKRPDWPTGGPKGPSGTSGVGEADVTRESGSEPALGCSDCCTQPGVPGGWVQHADGRYGRCKCHPCHPRHAESA